MADEESPKVDTPTKPWRWPGQWFRQESFWREVGSRTLAAVFAAGIVYVFAVAGGYIATPRALPFVTLAAYLAVGTFWTAKTSKLNNGGWYYTAPQWLLRLVDRLLQALLILILLWIFNVLGWR